MTELIPILVFMVMVFINVGAHAACRHRNDVVPITLALPGDSGSQMTTKECAQRTDQSFIDQVIDAVTDDHVAKGWYIGSPQEAAAQMQPLIDAGVDWVVPVDYLSMIGDPDEAWAAFDRMIDVCAAIKAANAT